MYRTALSLTTLRGDSVVALSQMQFVKLTFKMNGMQFKENTMSSCINDHYSLLFRLVGSDCN